MAPHNRNLIKWPLNFTVTTILCSTHDIIAWKINIQELWNFKVFSFWCNSPAAVRSCVFGHGAGGGKVPVLTFMRSVWRNEEGKQLLDVIKWKTHRVGETLPPPEQDCKLINRRTSHGPFCFIITSANWRQALRVFPLNVPLGAVLSNHRELSCGCV